MDLCDNEETRDKISASSLSNFIVSNLKKFLFKNGKNHAFSSYFFIPSEPPIFARHEDKMFIEKTLSKIDNSDRNTTSQVL